MEDKVINLSHYDSLAAYSAQKSAEVAAAAYGAISDLAKSITPSSDTIVITYSTSEPDDDSYWFYIEEVNDE